MYIAVAWCNKLEGIIKICNATWGIAPQEMSCNIKLFKKLSIKAHRLGTEDRTEMWFQNKACLIEIIKSVKVGLGAGAARKGRRIITH